MRTELNLLVMEVDKCKSGAGGWAEGGRKRTSKAVRDFKGLLQCEERTNLEGKNSLGPAWMKPQNPAIPCHNLVGTNKSGGTNQLNV